MLEIAHFYRNHLEGNTPLCIMLELARPIENGLCENQQKINQVLSEIINPNIATISAKALQKKYHLPDVI